MIQLSSGCPTDKHAHGALTCCTDSLTARFDGKRPDRRSWQPRQQGKREGLSGPVPPPLYLHTSVSVSVTRQKTALKGCSWHLHCSIPEALECPGISRFHSSPISRALSGHLSFPHNHALICKLSFITQTLVMCYITRSCLPPSERGAKVLKGPGIVLAERLLRQASEAWVLGGTWLCAQLKSHVSLPYSRTVVDFPFGGLIPDILLTRYL